MMWIALVLVIALVAGVLGTLLELALWAVVLVVLALVVAGLVLRGTMGSSRTHTRTRTR